MAKFINEMDAAATPSSVNGMGSVVLPGDPNSTTDFASQKTGSGDKPNPSFKRNKKFKTFAEHVFAQNASPSLLDKSTKIDLS